MSEGDPLVHLGDDDTPCKIHAPATMTSIMSLASIGARMSPFNHDIASKLQGLMMSLDELDELIEKSGDADLRRALEGAHSAVKDLNTLLTANRTLTRGARPTRTTLRDVVRHAAERSGAVLGGEVVAAPIECSVPALAHAISLAMEVCAGMQRLRSMQLTSQIVDGYGEVAFAFNGAPPGNASDLLALSAYCLGRERGTLHCAATQLVIRMPLAT